MEDHVFNIDHNDKSISNKIVVGLERISQAFKHQLWTASKKTGLSPIQIQILIFIQQHKTHQNTISYLAKEFNLTKATISDAVKLLHQKKLVRKKSSTKDLRSYHLQLTVKGKRITESVSNFADPIAQAIGNHNESDLYFFYKTLNEVLYQLNQNGILQQQRLCLNCQFFEKDKSFCHHFEQRLPNKKLRLDCDSFKII